MVTGLGIRTSDVDCYVAVPDWVHPTIRHVTRARNLLQRHYHKFAQVIAITAAKVPIVKFLHIPTNRQCDVNFKSPAGVQNSKLIAFLLDWDQRALPLAVLIKYWSKVHAFSGTNRLANYALNLLIVFYLQQKDILPSIYVLQKDIPSYMLDNWNTAFNDRMCSHTKNSDSLYDLLGGFFKWFSTFNFKENIISLYLGRAINRNCFEKLENVPVEYHLYKKQVSRGVCQPLKIDSNICVQDPFEHNRNCTAAVFDKLLQRIMSHFHFASNKFEEHKDNFLKAILTEDPNNIGKLNSKGTYQKNFLHNKIKKHKPKKRSLNNGFKKWFDLVNSTKR